MKKRYIMKRVYELESSLRFINSRVYKLEQRLGRDLTKIQQPYVEYVVTCNANTYDPDYLKVGGTE